LPIEKLIFLGDLIFTGGLIFLFFSCIMNRGTSWCTPRALFLKKHMGIRPRNEDIPMKKTRVVLLALVLTVATLLCAMTVLAQENPTATFTYTVAGQTVVCAEKTAVDGAVTMPDAPELLKGFVGWYAEIDGVAHLLPAGGVCNAVTADTVFTAFSVDFSTDTTEKTNGKNKEKSYEKNHRTHARNDNGHRYACRLRSCRDTRRR
jgi:hypothetical protein